MAISKEHTQNLLNKITDDLHLAIEKNAKSEQIEMEKVHRQIHPYPHSNRTSLSRYSAFTPAFHRFY